jgi:hypothetical protein
VPPEFVYSKICIQNLLVTQVALGQVLSALQFSFLKMEVLDSMVHEVSSSF